MSHHHPTPPSLLTGLALGLLVLLFDRLPEKVLWLLSSCLVIGGLTLVLGVIVLVINLW